MEIKPRISRSIAPDEHGITRKEAELATETEPRISRSIATDEHGITRKEAEAED